MNSTTKKRNDQAHRETFDATDVGIRAGWSSFLARYKYDCFATVTFKNARRDPFEVHNAFQMFLWRWQMTEAMAQGLARQTVTRSEDAYGRTLPDKRRWRGTYQNAYKRGHYRPVYCLGVEPHQSGDLHAHAVIRFTTPFEMKRTVGWRIWTTEDFTLSMNLGWSRIEPPASQGDVLGYCSKYVTKGGELFLSRSFNAKLDPRGKHAGIV